MECEEKYYQALQARQALVGFHPFKKMALDRELQRTAREYNEGLALLPDTKESKQKHLPLTTLEEWKRQSRIPVEEIKYGDDVVCEIPMETVVEDKPVTQQAVKLDLSDKIHTDKTAGEPMNEKGKEKAVSEIEKEL